MPYTAQEIFDKVVNHLRKQGSKSLGISETSEGTTVCVYRSQDGKKCAVGAVITDEQYRPEMEGKNSFNVIGQYCLEDLRPHEHLLADLQSVHDFHPICDWELRFQRIADRYDLIYIPPTIEG